MQIKIISVPIHDGEGQEDALNAFLRSHKVIDVRKELIPSDGCVYWSFCITYMQGAGESVSERKEKIDYKQLLDEETFARFAKMRTVRKRLAEEDAVPAYSVFIDAELAEFAKLEHLSLSAMRKVNGVGEKRIEKYGEKFLKAYEEEGKPDAPNNGMEQSADSLF